MNPSNCGDFEALIALEIAGDLPASEAAPVQRHLNECEPCRSFAAEMAADLQWLQSAHQEPLDGAALHQVRVGVMRRLESEHSRWDRPFGGLSAVGWRWQWIVATAAIAIVASAAWWGTSTSPRPQAVAVHSGNQNPQRPENVAPRSIQKTQPDLKASEGVAPPTERDSPAERENPVAASLPPASATAAGGVRQPRKAGLETGTQAEIVTALLNEPLEEPAEVVMLKIQTSNPDIVVYWVMDEEKQPQADVQNQGD